jgi:hypothetical protein
MASPWIAARKPFGVLTAGTPLPRISMNSVSPGFFFFFSFSFSSSDFSS